MSNFTVVSKQLLKLVHNGDGYTLLRDYDARLGAENIANVAKLCSINMWIVA